MANRNFYYPAIDGLRFYAFLFIFSFHFNSYVVSDFLSYTGWSSIELFFLLSGFLLTKFLVAEYKEKNSVQVYKYFMRRIFRIWPLYFIYLILIVIASLFFVDAPFSVSRLLGNIFLYDNIVTAVNGFNHNLASIHLWSISLEEQYYLVLPFLVPWLIKLDAKKIKLFFILSFAFLFLSRYLLGVSGIGYTFIYVLPFSGDSFLAGIIMGLGVYDGYLKKINSIVAFVAGAALLGLLYFLPGRMVTGFNQVVIYFVTTLAYSLIFISIVYTERGALYWFFANKPVRYLGKISFGLYIFHVVANRLTHSIFLKLNMEVDLRGFLLSLIITILLATLSYEFIEKPFLRIKKRFTVIQNRDI